MIDIISKKDGPRKEDVRLRKLIQENKGTITAMADHFSMGAYSASKQPAQQNSNTEQGKASYFILSAHDNAEPPKPYVRVSLNGRVVIVDDRTSKQMHFIGEVRHLNGEKVFLLATEENKFFSPADEDLMNALKELDHLKLGAQFDEDMLSAKIHEVLGLEDI